MSRQLQTKALGAGIANFSARFVPTPFGQNSLQHGIDAQVWRDVETPDLHLGILEREGLGHAEAAGALLAMLAAPGQAEVAVNTIDINQPARRRVLVRGAEPRAQNLAQQKQGLGAIKFRRHLAGLGAALCLRGIGERDDGPDPVTGRAAQCVQSLDRILRRGVQFEVGFVLPGRLPAGNQMADRIALLLQCVFQRPAQC